MGRAHPLDWIVEPLVDDPGYLRRPMFGCVASYYRGKLVAVLASGKEPWNGLLVPVERDQHASIVAEFPGLVEHAVLPKWLYHTEANEAFEQTANDLIECIRREDPRFGVVPKPKRKNRRNGTR